MEMQRYLFGGGLLILLASGLVFVGRLVQVLPLFNKHRFVAKRTSLAPTRILIVLGSGGHTAEMLSLLEGLDTRKYNHRSYLVSSGDALSASRAQEFENSLAVPYISSSRSNDLDIPFKKRTTNAPTDKEHLDGMDSRERMLGSYDITIVPRARAIHQSLLTTPVSCIACLAGCLRTLYSPRLSSDHLSVTSLLRTTLPPPPASTSAPEPSQTTTPTALRAVPTPSVARSRRSKTSNAEKSDDTATTTDGPERDRNAGIWFPDLIITNGPATGVIAVLASLLLRFLAVQGTSGKMRTVYVESWARVRRLSLSGKILLWLVDRFVVQWETLVPATWGRGEYLPGLLH